MKGTLLCVVAYDVPDDRRRTRLFKLLKQYGLPAQYSVFETRLAAHERRQLLNEAAKLLDKRSDRFTLYPIGAEQERGILHIGPERPDVGTPGFFLV